jgi:hypothetical protein
MRKIKLRSLALAEGNSESATAQRIFHLALDRFEGAIREIELALVDLNGPRGGVDKRCRARLSLVPRGTVVVDGVGETFLAALHAAAEKARRTLQRRLERRRSAVKATAA